MLFVPVAQLFAAFGTVGALCTGLYLLHQERDLRAGAQASRISVWAQRKHNPASHQPGGVQYFACIDNASDNPVYVSQMRVFPGVEEPHHQPAPVGAGLSLTAGTVPPHGRLEFPLDLSVFPLRGDLPFLVIYFLDVDRVSWRRDSDAVLEHATADTLG